MKIQKPPIGVMPKFINDERRLRDLSGAIKRYAKVYLVINPEWIEEYNELIAKISSRK